MAALRLRVREVAQAQRLDVAKLSRRAGLAYHTVYKLWNDPHRDVSLKTLAKLAQALGVSVHEMIEHNPDTDRSEGHGH